MIKRSLAVIYYEMLNGDLPWLASDPSSLLKMILQQPIINKLKSSKVIFFLLNGDKLKKYEKIRIVVLVYIFQRDV